MILYQDTTLNFGMYKGFKVYSLPKNYINWLKENTSHEIIDKPEPKSNLTEWEKKMKLEAEADDLHRRTCAKIGRQLIYENVEIPF